MKKYILFSTVSIMTIILAGFIAYYHSYNKALNDRENIVYETKSPKDKAQQAGSMKEKISHKCNMITINYQVKDNSKEKVITTVLPEYVGLTRQQLIDELNNQSENPNLNEINKGFIRAELISFSEDEITIQKTYSVDDIPDKYFIKLKGDRIVIYYADHKTVFENTQIGTKNLIEEEVEELKKGIPVEDEHKLISILEGYSS